MGQNPGVVLPFVSVKKRNIRTGRIEDDGRLKSKSRDMEDGLLLNNGIKDVRITVTGDE